MSTSRVIEPLACTVHDVQAKDRQSLPKTDFDGVRNCWHCSPGSRRLRKVADGRRGEVYPLSFHERKFLSSAL